MTNFTEHKSKLDHAEFDAIIVKRLVSEDFGQPALDYEHYRNKAFNQIESAIKRIRSATSQHDFSTAIAQANAFIDAAQDYEFIDLADKSKWLDEIAAAVRVQTLGDSV
ncbi:hypothetical protein CDG60_12365 [Acinetobacter chinensis]|uniref:Uncharacterized protein n=1 Tax=Acinetobacter chinensis TaxID=2004650 RepID=A0A3B7LY27_9GAMM|nr:hypothetical protein [Acinetobacter chinensis]AXY57291.1 hypothetical protein CDG60_12365 [Acinetobacter chinensis]